MRTLNASAGVEGHSHSHSHSHAPGLALPKADASSGKTSAVAAGQGNGELRKRGGKAGEKTGEGEVVTAEEDKKKEGSASLKLSAYLNLFGDFSGLMRRL